MTFRRDLYKSSLNHQVGGDHYRKFKIQPVEFIHANQLPFIEGNIVKYICRWREKGGFETLNKIKHYCDLLIDLELQKQLAEADTEKAADSITSILERQKSAMKSPNKNPSSIDGPFMPDIQSDSENTHDK